LADPDRGTVWEEMLIYLPRDIRILGLSATLSNLDEFAGWLSDVRGEQVEVVLEPKRAVPLSYHMASQATGLLPVERFNKQYAREVGKKKGKNKGRGGSRRRNRSGGGGGRRGRGKRDQTRHIHVIEMLSQQNFPAIYFIFSRALVERLAFDLANSNTGKRLVHPRNKPALDAYLDDFDAEHPGVVTSKLRRMYRRGIAFHHAGMHVALKLLVEGLYEEGLVSVLYSTSTFALGINMPARTVIFDALTKYNGEEIVPLTTREFMQMAGRAGRRGIDTAGDIVIRQDFEGYDEVQPLMRKLLRGESEPVTSSFNLSFHAIVNLLDRFSEGDIRSLLERSFKAHQSERNAVWLRSEIAGREELMDVASGPQPIEGKAAERLRKHRRRLASLKRQLLEEERPRLWEEFQRKVAFLRAHNYLAEDNELLVPARILQHIKIEEVFLTELILAGVFERLSAEEIYGVMCGLVQRLPRQARARRPSDRWREIAGQIFDVYDSRVVQHAAELVASEASLTPELMPLGERWAQGEMLSALMRDIDNPTDISGDIVGALRRAKDLVSQLRQVYWDDADRRRELGEVMRAVTRDEVEVL
ncbi:MAG: helicase-related protein, partial [Myxococcota bacterium]